MLSVFKSQNCTLFTISAEMGKVRRKRKYSHWKYINSQLASNSPTQSWSVLPSCRPPIEYQFPLCHLPAVLHQPSLYNNTSLKCLVLESDAFENSWNLIKHSQLFVMLCTLPESLIVQKIPSWLQLISQWFTKGIVTPTLLYIVGTIVIIYLIDNYM